MSKIDTQGMSMPIDPSDPNYKKTWNMQPHKPWLCTPTRVLTETMVKELKILINEVLDESCLLYTSPSPRDGLLSRMPSSA